MPKMRNSQPRIAPELKASDVNVSMAADTTGAILLLNGIDPGTALNQRIGRQILAKKLRLRLACVVTAATGADQTQRVMVVLDKQPNGVALAITDVLTSVGTTANYNLSNQARFKILFDRRVYLNATAEPFSAQLLDVSLGQKYVVQFNAGVAGTVADITTNSLYMITIGSNAAGATAGTVTGASRLRFSDE